MKGFKNASIYVEGRKIVKTNLTFQNGLITEIGDTACFEQIFIPQNAVVVPGFIDEHIHGSKGYDTMDAKIGALSIMADSLLAEGTTAFLATTMTQSKENIERALINANQYKKLDRKEGAELIGIHLEGPYISPKFIGAQPAEYVAKPDISEFDNYNKLSGNLIKIVTVAPEVDGAIKFIEHLTKNNIISSFGHTSATCVDIERAMAVGASNVTHTYNAQSPLHHRDIGTVGMALLNDNLNCEVICDTIHVSVPALKLLVKSKPHDKITLVTDAMRAKQMPEGESELGGQTVIVKNGEARLLNGALAGSVLKMNEAVKNMVALGVDFCDAIDFATINPAKNLRIDNLHGSIKAGKKANFTVLDENFEVLMTIREGEILYKK